MNIWQLVYFLLVPGMSWILGVRTAIWYQRKPPVSEGVDIFAIILAAGAACVYLFVLVFLMSAFLGLMHIDWGIALHTALCPLCSAAAPTVVSPQ